MAWRRKKTSRRGWNNGFKGKGKARARGDWSPVAEEEGSAEGVNTDEHLRSKESEVSKSAANNESLATGQAETDHREKEEEVEEEEEEEEMRRSVNLPLDLWLLVAENLDPLSLLYLARTTKTLYQTLMSKQHSKSIWKRSAEGLDLPSFQNKYLIGPALISFLYETTCKACGEDGAFEMSYTHLIRWHGGSKSDAADSSSAHECRDKIVLERETIEQKLPAMRSEVYKCVLVATCASIYSDAFPYVGPLKYYSVDQLVQVNSELLNYLPAGSKKEQDSAVRSFIESKQERLRTAEKDSASFYVWLESGRTARRSSLRDEVSQHGPLQRIGYKKYESIQEIFKEWKSVVDLPHGITREERATLIPALALAAKAHHDSKVEEERERKLRGYRLALKPRFDRLIGKLTLFPSFPIFLELSNVQPFWNWRDCYGWRWADSKDLGKEWTRTRRRIMKEVDDARRWMKLTLLRIASIELSRIGRPLSRDIRSELAISRDSRRPSRFAGISNSKNSTGLDVNDPATISNSDLARLLNLLWSKFDEINEETYQGPLFPDFNTYWHQVLLQVLKAVDFEDGSAQLTAKLIEELGPHFFCGLCSHGNTDGSDGMLASELLDHIRRSHPAQPSDTPQRSLVLFNKPAPAVAPVDEGVPVVEESARARRAAARLNR